MASVSDAFTSQIIKPQLNVCGHEQTVLTVSPVLFVLLQMSAADIKSEIRDLYITGAKQVSWP